MGASGPGPVGVSPSAPAPARPHPVERVYEATLVRDAELWVMLREQVCYHVARQSVLALVRVGDGAVLLAQLVVVGLDASKLHNGLVEARTLLLVEAADDPRLVLLLALLVFVLVPIGARPLDLLGNAHKPGRAGAQVVGAYGSFYASQAFAPNGTGVVTAEMRNRSAR